jgi:hypothetical protein
MRATFILAWVLLGCGEPPAPAPVASTSPGTVTTARGLYRLTWAPVPAPLPMGELFEVRSTVVDAASGAPVEVGSVLVDARMPEHGHGMATRPVADPGRCEDPSKPETCRHDGGVHVMRGMKFHMPGKWTITFDVVGPAGKDHAEVGFTL